ncbi:MAG: PAS domain-containing protein [Chroococcidiopsidaceae cyanobacterium CP_BM_ER_R8_30]|nr:PAS domain-containing protein [Chroococcidiopsidaceae cyanobacterium CP_BM_ER_R8_30]
MNIDTFTKQLQGMHNRLELLTQATVATVQEQSDLLLPRVLKELGTASEELQVAIEELLQQTEALITARAAVAAQRQQYLELFDRAPSPCLVTDELGTIQEANQAAAQLLKVEPQFLLGKPLLLFIAKEEQELFHCQLRWLQKTLESEEFIVQLCPRDCEPLVATVAVTPVTNGEGKPTTLYIWVRNVAKQRLAAVEPDSDLLEYSWKVYAKGELIPLPSQTIWQVREGVVKLSTVSADGSQVLVGLAGPGIPFGSSLSVQQTCRATALTKVELVRFSFTQLATTPHLAQTLLPHIQRRLQQTESLLAIVGKRHVKDRLFSLLQLLKQNFGHPTLQGVRLSIRFTHQDLADACSTTRVTITRLLCHLQEQGKIAYDSKKHIIFMQEIDP